MTDRVPVPNLAKILDALARHNVDYVLIGGQAALLHGATEPTSDVDVMTRDAPDNMEHLAAALVDLGAVSDMDEQPGVESLWGMNTRWTCDAGMIDVLVTAVAPNDTTINYNELEPRAETVARLGSDTVAVVASLEDLIIMKVATGRERDLAVVRELVAGSTAPHLPGMDVDP